MHLQDEENRTTADLAVLDVGLITARQVEGGLDLFTTIWAVVDG
jgi:hypothetical protein